MAKSKSKSTVDIRLEELKQELQDKFAEWQALLLQDIVIFGLAVTFLLLSLRSMRFLLLGIPVACISAAWAIRKRTVREELKELQQELMTLHRSSDTAGRARLK